MQAGLFTKYRADINNPNWESLINRESSIQKKENEVRSDFFRDYSRILHSKAYRRLKHKSQVFYATQSDHICTRIEHVTLVASISYTIAKYLGLETELTNAISIGHDLGHAPFAHQGEHILKKISSKYLENHFWHEKNSLNVIDNLETLKDSLGKEHNLNLTYAVRDGIVLHCGEVDDNGIFPRSEFIDLSSIHKANQYSPITWEGCIVKISDKIAYLGRDIDDAIRLNILEDEQINELNTILKDFNIKEKLHTNTTLVHNLIVDICSTSSPENGIKFSDKYTELMIKIKEFNYKNIYFHKRLKYFNEYAELIINSLFNVLMDAYTDKNLHEKLSKYKNNYPELFSSFIDWEIKYSDMDPMHKKMNNYENKTIYNNSSETEYARSAIHFIASMSDTFALRCFGELTKF